MTEENEVDIVEDELESLKARADTMGVQYHPSIGLDKLKEKVDAKMAEQAPAPEPEPTVAPAPKMVQKPTEAPKPAVSAARQKRREAAALVRISITCMNPNKKEWEGEIFCVSNSVVGTIKKYVPFNTEWHVPQFILNMIEARKCQVFQAVKRGGKKVREGKLIHEFSVSRLPPLSGKELKDLAQRQAMANGTDA
jgi:hypothetical protein